MGRGLINGTKSQLEVGSSGVVLLHSKVTMDNNSVLCACVKETEERILNVFTLKK